MKRIAILGSTGSIGTQALEIIRENPDQFALSALSCNRRIDELCWQIEEFHPQMAVVKREEDALFLQQKYPKLHVAYGERGLIEAATCDCQMVLNSLVGMQGLVPTYHAIKAKKDIALANKETLVTGGQLIMDAVKEKEVRLLPVDSEHSAIFQCLQGNNPKQLRKILLTASGGPFRGYTLDKLEKVTLEQALNHPKWNMGSKITIDSATMMNKGLEVIEAKWLFDVSLDQIQVVVHPQSIVHSAVEYQDGSVIAQMGNPDMRVPISYAFGYPQRMENNFESFDIFQEDLTFQQPDLQVFRCIQMAFEASRKGGSYPAVLNGVNEVLVQLFLERKINFIDIQRCIEQVLDKHKPKYNLDLETILEADREARNAALELVCAGRN